MIIVFEGSPGGGKTTLLEELAPTFHGEVIPEILDQSLRWQKAKRQEDQNFFWRNDVEKLKKAKGSGSGLVLVDRAHPATLAYNYANWAFQRPNDFERLLNRYFLEIRGQLEPDAYVLFSIPAKLVVERKGPEEKNQPWRDPAYLNKIALFYEFFFRVIEPDAKVFLVDSAESREKVLKCTERILRKTLKS